MSGQQVAPATGRCQAGTVRGRRCMRKALWLVGDSKLCQQHTTARLKALDFMRALRTAVDDLNYVRGRSGSPGQP